MTAEVRSFPRVGSACSPLVPARVDVQDAPDFRFNIARMLDSDWYHSCSKEEALAGINLHARAIHQLPAGSLPSADNLLARLADFGRDVAGWLVVKAKALEGWVLCSDGRWYQPDVARNALHIWVGRLEKRRASAFANQKQCPDRDFGMDEIEEDLLDAHAALRAIDPQDPVLRESTTRMMRWRASRDKLALVASNGGRIDDEDPSRTPTRVPTRGPTRVPQGGDPIDGIPQDSSAKLSPEDSSSSLREDDSSDPQNDGGTEVDEGGGSVKRTPIQPSKAPPWPSGWFEAFKARYPRKEAWGRAEKVLERIRKAGRIPFEEILAGVDRLVAEGRVPQYTPIAATWLNDRGWENEVLPQQPVPARTGHGPRSGPQRNPHFAFAESMLEHEP